MGLVAADRVFTVLDKTDKIIDQGDLKKEKLDGDIRFDNVRFSYDGKQDVLKGISFDVKAGTTLALVGSTGSGKTTIINLVSRFYDIQSGTIMIGGIDIKDYNLEFLRSSDSHRIAGCIFIYGNGL